MSELQQILDCLVNGNVCADFEILNKTGLNKKILRGLLRGLVVLEWIEEVDRVKFTNGAGALTYRITKLGRTQLLEDAPGGFYVLGDGPKGEMNDLRRSLSVDRD